MSLLCIDIGNTHTHYGVVGDQGTEALHELPTRLVDHPTDGFGPLLTKMFYQHAGIEAVALCSVVPKVTPLLVRVFELWRLKLPIFQLTADKNLGIPISYPRPQEIGQDRLANAVAAHALVGSPAIVIDLGTAVTFDIVTRTHGYEGGIIAPGLEVMRRYLHERTAQLPLLDDSVEITRAIGRSTIEAMRIGTVIGFGGMISALLDAVVQELRARGEPEAALISTGGTAGLLHQILKRPFHEMPDLTLRGLAAAYRLNHA